MNIPKNWENKNLNDKDQLFKIKQEANIAIEAKEIKEIDCLEAEVKLSINKDKFELLKNLI